MAMKKKPTTVVRVSMMLGHQFLQIGREKAERLVQGGGLHNKAIQLLRFLAQQVLVPVCVGWGLHVSACHSKGNDKGRPDKFKPPPQGRLIDFNSAI